MSSKLGAVGGLVGLTLLLAGPVTAAPPDDSLLPPAMHKTEKGRRLATKHAAALRDLNAEIYHCMPWVEIAKNSIGFFRPKNAPQDDRYLSIRIFIEQEPSVEFARLGIQDQASAMFSRYAGPILRRMTRHASVLNDDGIDGFTVILEWVRQGARAAGGRPIHETVAVFVPKVDADEYLDGRSTVRELATRARVLGWDGETPLGPLKVSAWEDNFVASFQVKDYQPEPGVRCP